MILFFLIRFSFQESFFLEVRNVFEWNFWHCIPRCTSISLYLGVNSHKFNSFLTANWYTSTHFFINQSAFFLLVTNPDTFPCISNSKWISSYSPIQHSCIHLLFLKSYIFFCEKSNDMFYRGIASFIGNQSIKCNVLQLL